MISVFRKNDISTSESEREVELRGLSTDDKPTDNVANGTTFIEIDTGKMYLYDAENEQWQEI